MKDKIIQILHEHQFRNVRIVEDRIILSNDVQIPFSKIQTFKYDEKNKILSLYGDNFICDIKVKGAYTLQRK